MNAEILFSILNTAVLPAWALLIVLPRWRWTRCLVTFCRKPGRLYVSVRRAVTFRATVFTGSRLGTLSGF